MIKDKGSHRVIFLVKVNQKKRLHRKKKRHKKEEVPGSHRVFSLIFVCFLLLLTLPFAFLQKSQKQQEKQWLLAVAGNRKTKKSAAVAAMKYFRFNILE